MRRCAGSNYVTKKITLELISEHSSRNYLETNLPDLLIDILFCDWRMSINEDRNIDYRFPRRYFGHYTRIHPSLSPSQLDVDKVSTVIYIRVNAAQWNRSLWSISAACFVYNASLMQQWRYCKCLQQITGN